MRLPLAQAGRSGAVHDLTLNGPESSCDCAGFCYTDSCRHLHCTRELVEAGVLAVAPDAAGECDGGGEG